MWPIITITAMMWRGITMRVITTILSPMGFFWPQPKLTYLRLPQRALLRLLGLA